MFPDTNNTAEVKFIVLNIGTLASLVVEGVRSLDLLQSDVAQIFATALEIVAAGDFIETTLSLKDFQADIMEQATTAGELQAIDEARLYAILVECLVEEFQKHFDAIGLCENEWHCLSFAGVKHGNLFLIHSGDTGYE